MLTIKHIRIRTLFAHVCYFCIRIRALLVYACIAFVIVLLAFAFALVYDGRVHDNERTYIFLLMRNERE